MSDFLLSVCSVILSDCRVMTAAVNHPSHAGAAALVQPSLAELLVPPSQTLRWLRLLFVPAPVARSVLH